MDEWNETDLQRMVNSGQAWRMEGTFGRGVMAMIENGALMLGVKGLRDFYGSYVPGRDEVQPGTKGSRDYVVARFGEDYARKLEAADTLH